MTHFLASAWRLERGGGALGAGSASLRGGRWPPGRAPCQPRAMASEGPREPGEVRPASPGCGRRGTRGLADGSPAPSPHSAAARGGEGRGGTPPRPRRGCAAAGSRPLPEGLVRGAPARVVLKRRLRARCAARPPVEPGGRWCGFRTTRTRRRVASESPSRPESQSPAFHLHVPVAIDFPRKTFAYPQNNS